MDEKPEQVPEGEDETVSVPIVMGEPDGPAVFSNFMGVQFHEGVFVLTFGQMVPPFITGDPEAKRERWASLESIEIQQVARVILTPEKARDVIQALEENVSRNAPVEGTDDEPLDEDNGNTHTDKV